MMLIMIFTFFVGITDVYVAGFIGPKVQAAVGFVAQIYFLIIIVANAVSIGTLAMMSRAIGAGDFRRAIEIAKQSLLFGMLLAGILTSFCLLFYRQIASIAGFPREIREIAATFLKIFSFALGPNYLLIISNAIFRASGEAIKPMLTMLVVSVINIVLDFVLVFGFAAFPGLGYPGIALSTTIASLIGMCMNLIMFAASFRWREVYTDPDSISIPLIKSIVALSWPAALLQIAWNMASIFLYNILSRLKETGIIALAAIANGLRIEAIIFLPAFAFNMAASVLVGQNLGAGEPERAESTGWKIAAAGMTVTSLMAMVIFIWAKHFASFLSAEQAVINETARYLRFNMLSEPFMALSTILGGSLQGAGDTRGTMWIIIFSMWLIRLPLAALFALTLNYGAAGVWTAMVASMTLQGLLMSWRFRRGGWKKLELR